MATEETQIVISERGGQQVADTIAKIGKAAEDSSKPVKKFGDSVEDVGKRTGGADAALSSLRRTLGLVAGAFAVDKLKGYVDAYTGIQNKLRLVTKDQDELNATYQKLFDIANKTRAPLEGTVDLYSKLAQSSKQLNISQQDVALVVEQTNKLIAQSGATGAAAKGGLIQFTQGLTSGRLGGEELRSVLENLPALALALAKGLNTTTGELRNLGAQGKLTPQVIIEALKRVQTETDAAFKNFTPTIDQAFTILQNKLTDFIGKTANANGALKLISNTILFVADNLDTIANALTTAGIAFGAFKVATFIQGIYSAVTAVGAFNAIILANPLVAFSVILAGVIAAMITFGDQIQIGSDKTQTLGAVAKVALGELGKALLNVIKIVLQLVDYFVNGIVTIIDSVKSLVEWLGKAFTAKNKLDGATNETLKTQTTSTGRESTSGFDIPSDMLNFANGGRFRVGGSGGTDSQLVQFMASPNETVSIQTPSQVARGGLPRFANGGALVPANANAPAAFQAVLASNSTENTFKTATEEGTASGFKALSSTQVSVGGDIVSGLGDNRSTTVSVGGNINSTIVSSGRNTSSGLSAVKSSSDMVAQNVNGTTGAVDRVNGAVVALGSKLDDVASAVRSAGGSQKSGLQSFGSGGSSVNGLSNATAGGSFTINTLPDFGTWLGNFNAKPVGLAKNLAETFYRYAQDLTNSDSGKIPQSQVNEYIAKIRQYKKFLSDEEIASLGGMWDSLSKFRSGGSMMVGGSGSVDDQLVALRATKGERIDVLTRAQQDEEAKRRQRNGRPLQVNIVVNTPDADSFRRSQTQVLQQFAGRLNRAVQNG